MLAPSARRRGDCGGQIHVDAQRGGLRHDVSDLTLEAEEKAAVSHHPVERNGDYFTFFLY